MPSILEKHNASASINLWKQENGEFTTPSVKKEGEPESGELVWDLRVEER